MQSSDEQALKARLQGELGNIKANLESKEFRDFLKDWIRQIDELLRQSST